MSVDGYRLLADWSRGGDYSGTLETLSTGGHVVKDTDIIAKWGRTEPRTTQDAAAGEMSFTLNNQGRQFSPENAASPIAGRVVPGTPVKLTVDVAGTTETIFEAPIDKVAVASSVNNAFSVECLDGWGKPGNTQLSTAVYAGQLTGTLIGVILDAIGWPADKRDIDPGVTLVPYWWAEGVDASTAVDDLVHSDGPPAIAYVRSGVFYFRDRHHRVTDAEAMTSQGTCTHIIPSGPIGTDHKILKGAYTYDHGLDHIVNSATIEVSPRVPDVRQVVWSSEDSIALGINEEITLVIRTDDPFIDLQMPSRAITYTDEDEVLTRDYQTTAGSVSFILSRTSGQSALLTIIGGPSGAYIPGGIKLRGTPLKAGPSRVFTATDTGSQAIYGESEWPGSAPWAYFYDAQAIVDQIVTIYAHPMPTIEFSVDARLSDTTKAFAAAAEISQRITVRVDAIGLNDDFIIEQITHTIRRLGDRHILTIGAQMAEPIQAVNPFTFNVAGAGFNQGQFTLATGNNPTTMFRFGVAGQGFNQGVFSQ